jgi:hypothetical protein
LTGTNPESFGTAVVVHDDVTVVVIARSFPGSVVVTVAMETTTMVKVVGEPVEVTVTVGGKLKGSSPSADIIIVNTLGVVGDVFPTNEVPVPERIGTLSRDPVCMETCCPLVAKNGLEIRPAEAWG